MCPTCGDRTAGDSGFCSKCGTRLTPSRPHPEERKVVTSLFCDLVGFTALSERADPEDVDRLLRRFYAMARRVVESYGGVVEKFVGDAVVAVFGVPAAHEDDPERAVRAALRVVEQAEALEPLGDTLIRVRCGVNTGEALVSLEVDPSSGEGFLTGDAVNTAARLQAAAPPMGVLVGQATHDATERVFEYDERGAVALKGKADPVRAWLAGAARARTGSELRSFSSRFIGRELELGFLRGLLDMAVASGSPQMGLIVGEPGIGKSRLVAEFGRYLDELPEPVALCQGRCLPYGEGVTFWSLGEVVKAYAGVLETDGVARAETKLDAILPDGNERDWFRQRLRPLLGLEAEQASREENFGAWRRFLEGLASSGPAVLVFEDIHWADAGMLAFLDNLLGSTAQVPLLVLCTGRPQVLELNGDGAAFVQHARRLDLEPLSPAETAQLVLARLDATSLPAALQATILERSGGNPLFAEEMARLIEDRELLVRKGGVVTLKEGADVPLPESIQALIAARLDVLTPERKALLADAAVVGKTFWAGAVAAVGERRPGDVFEGLHELVAKELVRPVRGSSMEGETEFVFLHVLTRDVVYGQLPRAARAEKHAAAAEWIEEKTGGRTEDLSEILAYHYATALDMAGAAGLVDLAAVLSEPTARYLSLAGDRALPLDAVAAQQHYTRAHQVVDAARPRRRRLFPRRRKRARRKTRAVLVGAAAAIAVAIVAALAVWALMPSTAPSPVGAHGSHAAVLTPLQIQSKYGRGVVRITATVPVVSGEKLGWKHVTGSGFVASKDGTIFTTAALFYHHWLTNWVGNANRFVGEAYGINWVTVEFWGAQGQYTRLRGFVLGEDDGFGTALISVDPTKVHLLPIPLGESEAVRKGQAVVALSRQGVTISSAAGALSGIWRATSADTGKQIVTTLRTDANFPSGAGDTGFLPFLGAPLIDTSGHVVGVVGPNTNPTAAGEQTFGCAQAIDGFVSDVAWFSKYYRGIRTWLSCGWTWVRPGLAKSLHLAAPRGVLVQIVDPGGPAARAGIRGGTVAKTVGGTEYLTNGDLIVAAGGAAIRSENDWNKFRSAHKPGDTVRLKLYRGRRLISVKVMLAAFPWTPPAA